MATNLETGLGLYAHDGGKLVAKFTKDAMGRVIYDPNAQADGYSNNAVCCEMPENKSDVRFFDWSLEKLKEELISAVRLIPSEQRNEYMALYPNAAPASKAAVWIEGKDGTYPIEQFKLAVAALPDQSEPDYQRYRAMLIDVGAEPIVWEGVFVDRFYTTDSDLAPNEFTDGWIYQSEIIKPCRVGMSANQY